MPIMSLERGKKQPIEIDFGGQSTSFLWPDLSNNSLKGQTTLELVAGLNNITIEELRSKLEAGEKFKFEYPQPIV